MDPYEMLRKELEVVREERENAIKENYQMASNVLSILSLASTIKQTMSPDFFVRKQP